MTKRMDLLSASDETIDGAVSYADPLVLRGLLYQLTGDEELVGVELGTLTSGYFLLNAVAREADVAMLRAKAAAFLKAYRDSGAGEIGMGPPERLFRSLSLTAGTQLPEAEREIWLEQSALNPWARGVEWKVPPPPEDGNWP